MSGRLRSTLGPAATLLAAVALHLPSLRIPAALDDLVQHAMLRGLYPVARAPWALYDFIRDTPAEHDALRRAGMLPWWHDPHFRLTMFRPLASLLRAADHRLLGDRPVALHVESLGWFALTLGLAWAVFRRLLGPRAALLAVALLGASPRFVMPLGWIANRCALTAFAFALAAVLAYLRWRDQPRPAAAALTLAAAAASLLSAEYALGVLAIIPVIALVDRRARRTTFAASAIVLAAYLAARVATHAGVHGSSLYADPLADPLAFARQAPERFAALALATLTGADVDLGLPVLPLLVAAACVLSPVAVLVAVRFATPSTRRAVAVLSLSSLLALASVTGGSWGTSRLVAAASLWLAPLVAALAAEAVAAARDRRTVTFALAPVAVLLVYAHGPHAVVSTARGYAVLAERYQASVDDALNLVPRDTPFADARLLVLNAADPQTLYFGRATRLAWDYAVPASWSVLASTHAAVAFERVDERTFDLSCAGGLLGGFGARWFTPARERVSVGARTVFDGIDIEVLESGPRGPTRIRYRLEASLEDRRWWITTRLGGRLARLGLPRSGAVMNLPAP